MGLMPTLYRRLFRHYTSQVWPTLSHSAIEGESLLNDEGADDTWPDEHDDALEVLAEIDAEACTCGPSEGCTNCPPRDCDGWSDPLTGVVEQWGLKLPDESICWGMWQNINLDAPLDRLRVIATLQKTALNMGFAEGEQLEDFLAHYAWAKRDLRITTQYTDVTEEMTLSNPAAAQATPNPQVREG